MKELLRRYLLASAAFLFAGVTARADPALPAQLPVSVYTQPQTLVTIAPKLRLNLYCLGKGSPTVLLEAGLGNDMLTWRDVQGQIAQFTQVCAYDRAGYGFSDAAQLPADLNSVTDNLQRLILAAPIKTPIVLVGHSIGGEFATMFASKYRNEVAGMVLIDPAFADDEMLLTASLPKARQNFVLAMDQGMIAQERGCVNAIAAKQHDAATKIPDQCLDDPPNSDPALHLVLNEQEASVPFNAAVLAELVENTQPTPTTQSANSVEIDHADLNFGDMPLVVLTAADHRIGATPAESSAVYAAWLAGHQSLAHHSTNGWSIEVAKSGHFIQNDQPGAVIDAVRSVVVEVRGPSP